MNSYVADVMAATSSVSFFGTDAVAARKKYLLYAKHVHPDREGGSNEAFATLQNLYGGHVKPSTPSHANVVSTRLYEYVLGDTTRENEIFKTVSVAFQTGPDYADRVIADMLIPLAARDNDLMGAMSKSLKKLGEVPDSYKAFFPTMIERFLMPQPGGRRAAVVLEAMPGFVSIEDIMKAYPNGINGRDVAWMFKRMLVAVGNAADVGISHGACVPSSFMILPDQHGLILRDWQYSVALGEPLSTVPSAYKSMYPEATLKKGATTPNLDLVMAAKTASALLETDSPRPLISFFKGCLGGALPTAAALLAEFDDVLLSVYGKPAFHRFAMPKE